MKQASVSSTDHGGGKRRAGMLNGDLNQGWTASKPANQELTIYLAGEGSVSIS
jgi:hypothetical protein